MTSYLDDLTPGSGLRTPPRAWLASDAPQLDLDGEWRFRWSPTAAGLTEDLAAPDTDDAGWDTITVPGHWVLPAPEAKERGWGQPVYTNVQYPFPVDPPRVPDENPTGDYRRSFERPDWSVPRVLLRFDGVESVYRVWLNGEEVGVGKGSRLVQEFDVTDLLVPGRNVLAVRVHQWSSMSYVEDQDQWWLPGIFRSVTLLGRPAGALDDVWLRAGYADGTGTLDPEIVAGADAFPVRVVVDELGVDRVFAGPEQVAAFTVGAVQPWSAEVPRLYDAQVVAGGETVRLRIGFRTVAVRGDQLTVNGRKVVFRGVNRHETHPEKGRVFDEEYAHADLLLMKQSNINAIRTSHYPPHPRVLELADELGFWVVDECDYETHGFFFQDWAGNPSDDPDWEEVCLDRMHRTVERDKNHPCVILWSLGNEAGTGRNLAQMAHQTRRRDPGRPVHYEGDYTCAYVDVYSRMYPNFIETEAIGGEAGPVSYLNAPAEARRVRSLPFLMCEYAHAMGNGAGGMDLYDDLAERYPRLHGGFIWEWRDHGLLTRTADGVPYYGYGGDFGEAVHDGNFVMDGMVLPDGSPTPSLAEFAQVSAPVRFGLTGSEVTVRNRQHTVDTGGLRVVATVEHDGRPVSEEVLAVPPAAPGETCAVPRPTGWTAEATGETWLTLRAELAEDTPWAAAGHVVARQQFDLTPAPAPARPAWPADPVMRPAGALITLGPASFDAATGRLRRLFDLDADGPRLELWRGPTDNDRSDARGSFELGAPEDTAGEGAPGPSSDRRWRDRGLDRLQHRVHAVAAGSDRLLVRVRVAAANSGLGVDVGFRWRLDGDALALLVEVVPSPGWDCTWPRVGVRFDLPPELGQASWFGTGPAESYPDSRVAARVGRFSASLAELNVAYSRPQETGHRAGLRTLELGDGTRTRLRVDTWPAADGHRPGFTLTPYTPHDLDRAGHPYELPEPRHSYLYLDDAVHGLGSRACGVDVLPEHALWPGARQFAFRFSG